MASLNKVMLIGNLTRDPELRYIPSGSAVTSFTVAMNRVYKLQTGEKKEEVSFVRVVVWGRLAEVCNDYLKKGRPVFVEGRLQSRSWDDKNSGEKRSTLEVVAQSIQFLGQGGAGGGAGRGREEMPEMSSSDKEEMPEIQLEESGKGADEEVPF
jgi:single-strand DNA-binding protein